VEAGLPCHPSSSRRSRDCHRRGCPISQSLDGRIRRGVSRRRRHARRGQSKVAAVSDPSKRGGHDMNVDAIIHHRGWVLYRVGVRQSERRPGARVPTWWLRARSPAGAARAVPSCWRRPPAQRSSRTWSGIGIGRWHGAQVSEVLLGRVLPPTGGSGSITSSTHSTRIEVGYPSSGRSFYQLNPIAAARWPRATGVGLSAATS